MTLMSYDIRYLPMNPFIGSANYFATTKDNSITCFNNQELIYNPYTVFSAPSLVGIIPTNQARKANPTAR